MHLLEDLRQGTLQAPLKMAGSFQLKGTSIFCFKMGGPKVEMTRAGGFSFEKSEEKTNKKGIEEKTPIFFFFFFCEFSFFLFKGFYF